MPAKSFSSMACIAAVPRRLGRPVASTKAQDLLYRRVQPVPRLLTNILFVSIDDDDASILHHHHRWLQLSMGETMLKIELIKNKRDYCCSMYNRRTTRYLNSCEKYHLKTLNAQTAFSVVTRKALSIERIRF